VTRLTHAKLKQVWLRDSEIRAAYDALEEEFALMREMIRARKKSGKTQADVAKLMKTTPSVVSRLESANHQPKHSPSFETLKKYAHALDRRLSIKLVKKSGKKRLKR